MVIVTVNLEAKESTVYISDEHPSVKAYTYNGSIPGPEIRANVGDEIIVNYKNSLPETTTIHWHGIDVPAIQDGSFISQVHISPGKTFQYKFEVHRAGTFWYHSHVSTFHQVHKGLRGALIVSDPDEDSLDIPTKFKVLTLGDQSFKNKDEFETSFSSNPIEGGWTRFNGRLGTVFTVNGTEKPKFKMCSSVTQRLKLINISNSRFMRLDIPNHDIWRIGGDGGLLETPISIQHIIGESDKDPSHGILLTPGERADIVFNPRQCYNESKLVWYDLPRGLHSLEFQVGDDCKPFIKLGDDPIDGKQHSTVIATFKYCNVRHSHNSYSPPLHLITIPKILTPEGTPVLPILYGHKQPTVEGDVTFFASPKPFLPGMMGPKPFEELLELPAQMPKFKPDDIVIIKIINATAADHNYHLHGFPFQLIKTTTEMMDGTEMTSVPAPYLENKDTIIIGKRPGMMGTKTVTYLAVKFATLGRTPQELVAGGGHPTIKCNGVGENKSGGWLYHCHIAEHADTGMAGYIQIEL